MAVADSHDPEPSPVVTLATIDAEATATSTLGERLAFWASVGLLLTFSQCWVMLLTGPPTSLAPIDPEVSAKIRNFYFPTYFVVLVLGLSEWRKTGVAILRSPVLALLLALPFISMLWSIDPDVSQRRAAAVLFTTLAGVVIAARFSWPRFMEVLATAFGIVAVLCFIFALFFPKYGRMTFEFPGAWEGVWSQKNSLGFNMSIGFMVFVAAAIANPQRRWLWIAGAGAAVLLIVLSTSKTSLASFLIGCACVGVVMLARRGPVGGVLATFLTVTALMALIFIMSVDANLLLGLLGKDSTLTGRTKIWAAVLHQIQKQPITGYGYGAVWDDTSRWGPLAWISKDQGFVIHEAHNSWLGIWLELGYIGLGVWGLFFAELWTRTAVAIYRRPLAYLALPFLAVFSLHTMTETIVLVQNDWTWMLLAAIAVKLASPWDQDERREARRPIQLSTKA